MEIIVFKDEVDIRKSTNLQTINLRPILEKPEIGKVNSVKIQNIERRVFRMYNHDTNKISYIAFRSAMVNDSVYEATARLEAAVMEISNVSKNAKDAQEEIDNIKSHKVIFGIYKVLIKIFG